MSGVWLLIALLRYFDRIYDTIAARLEYIIQGRCGHFVQVLKALDSYGLPTLWTLQSSSVFPFSGGFSIIPKRNPLAHSFLWLNVVPSFPISLLRGSAVPVLDLDYSSFLNAAADVSNSDHFGWLAGGLDDLSSTVVHYALPSYGMVQYIERYGSRLDGRLMALCGLL